MKTELADYAFAIILFEDGTFFIPGDRNSYAAEDFDTLGGEYIAVNFPLGPGWFFKDPATFYEVEDMLTHDEASYITIRAITLQPDI